MKIDIIGSVASGKTTLAGKLSERYNVPFYEKDNIVWKRTPSGDVRRSEQEREQLFLSILEQENWIVEGSPRKILWESFGRCDYIILLDVNTMVRIYRAVRRFIRQRAGKERYNTAPTLKFFGYTIKWIFEYNRERREVIKKLSAYGSRFKIFTSTRQAERFVRDRYG